LIKEELRWAPSRPLEEGLTKTYEWIEQQVHANKPALAKVS
jgi:dTDP-D-glucose 4,6-dehydratase